MLEYGVVTNSDMKQKLVTVLQTTRTGKQKYWELCERQMALQEMVIVII